MRKVTNSAAHAPFSCHDSGHGFVWFPYEPRRDPAPFTRTCASRMAHRLCQTSIIFRLFEQSERSSSASHTKFHGIFNIQTWIWSPLHSHGSYNKFYFMPINPFIHFPMAHLWSDRLSFFRSSSYACGFFRTASSPFTNLLVLCPKTAHCPEAAAQATTAAAADQAADHCKAFPKPLRAGFWLAAILTRSERGANDVRTRSEIKFWETDPLSLLTKSLVATRFQNSKTQELSAVEQKRKPSQAAAAGKSKETEEETKGE